MNFLAIGVLVVFIGIPGVVALLKPSTLFSIIEKLQSPKLRYFSGGIRILMGVIFWFAAGSSHDAELIRIFAGIFFVAGVFTLFFPQDKFEKMLGWFASWPELAVRFWGVAALALAYWLIGLF